MNDDAPVLLFVVFDWFCVLLFVEVFPDGVVPG